MFVKKKIKFISWLIVILVFGISLHLSKEDNFQYRYNWRYAINIGHEYAYSLFMGNKRALRRNSLIPQSKINEIYEHPAINNLSIRMHVINMLQADKPVYERSRPLGEILHLEKEDLVPTKYEYKNNLILVTTFEPKVNDIDIKIPEKGKLRFSLAMRYYESTDQSPWRVIIRKAANLPIINLLFSDLGTAGNWYIYDYHYHFNQDEYLAWFIKDGNKILEKENEDNTKELMELLNSWKTKEGRELFDKKIDDGLSKSLEWGSDWIRTE